jgi:hypothetical protein
LEAEAESPEVNPVAAKLPMAVFLRKFLRFIVVTEFSYFPKIVLIG